MLQLKELHRPGLEPVSLSLENGDCAMLMGPSGAGKSLFLRAIADLDPNSGEALLDGAARGAMPAPRWRGLVGYLAAEPGWWQETAGAHFPDWPAARGPAEDLLLPGDIANRTVESLSTGERQRLAFLRLLVNRPRVMLLDEPTGPLDGAARSAVEAKARRFQESGGILLWVTHDSEQATRMGTRQLRMTAGRLNEVAP